MAKTAAERRTARKRKQQGRSRLRTTERHPLSADEAVGRLVAAGAAAAAGPDADPELLAETIRELAAADPAVDTHGHVARLLPALLGELWEDGWQPADVVHVVRRGASAGQLRLAFSAIGAQAHASTALARAPEEWTAQLRRLGADTGPTALSVASWRREQRLAGPEAWREALLLAGLLGTLGRIEPLAPPPSTWAGRPARRRPGTRTAVIRECWGASGACWPRRSRPSSPRRPRH